MKLAEPKQISNFFGGIIAKKHAWKLELFKRWEEIIGDLKNRVTIEKIEGTFLVLRVTHSVWAHEIFMLSEVIRKKINSSLGKEYINTIRIKTAKASDKNKKSIKVCKKIFPIDLKKISLSKIEEKALSNILDHELRNCLQNFGLCCKKGRNERKGKKE